MLIFIYLFIYFYFLFILFIYIFFWYIYSCKNSATRIRSKCRCHWRWVFDCEKTEKNVCPRNLTRKTNLSFSWDLWLPTCNVRFQIYRNSQPCVLAWFKLSFSCLSLACFFSCVLTAFRALLSKSERRSISVDFWKGLEWRSLCMVNRK